MSKAVDNTVRRKWDIAEFEEKAKQREEKNKEHENLSAKQKKIRERDPLHLGLIKERKALQKQEGRVNYEARVGKSQVVNLTGDRSQQGGFYCALCDILMKDSLAFADHLNGKMHQRMLGMSMRTEKVGVNDVKSKLAALKRKRDSAKQADPEKEYEERMAKLMEEEEKVKQQRKQQKLERKLKAKEELQRAQEEYEENVDEDVMATMGFTGFGGSKK